MPYRILIPDEIPYSSGVENVAIAIVGELLRKVESVTWLVEDPKKSEKIKKRLPNSDNLKIAHFKNWNGSTSKKNNYLHHLKAGIKRLPLLRRGAEAVYRGLVDQRISVIAAEIKATHCWFHFLQGQSLPKLSIPVCGVIHDQNFRFFPENISRGKSRQFKKAVKQWLNGSDMLTVLSDIGRQELLEINPTPHPQIEIIPNAIKLPRSKHKAEKRCTIETPTFLYPAAALSHKNHHSLFRAVKRLGQMGYKFKLVICGEGTRELVGTRRVSNSGAEKARAFYDANRNYLNVFVEAIGHCKKESLENLYSSCVAVVLPSQYEGFGLPLVEALSRSTPVICNRLIPFKEQVERYDAHDWVQWVNANDVDSIVEAIESKLNSDNKSFSQRVFPRERLEAWTWVDVAERYMQLFEEVHQKFRNS